MGCVETKLRLLLASASGDKLYASEVGVPGLEASLPLHDCVLVDTLHAVLAMSQMWMSHHGAHTDSMAICKAECRNMYNT